MTKMSNMMASVLVLVLLALASSLSSAQNQQQQRPRNPQQQQRQQAPSGSFDRIAPDTPILALSPAQLQRFLENPNSVRILTICFNDEAKCETKTALNLVNQIRNLGPGGNCSPTCSPQQQQQLKKMVQQFVHVYQTSYPEQWVHIRPHLTHIIGGG